MSILGTKGTAKLNDLAEGLSQNIQNSNRWQQMLQIPGLEDARLEVRTSYEIIPISVSGIVTERIDCDVPDPCYCVKESWLQTYRVKYRIMAYMIDSDIIGWDPEIKPNGANVTGRNYEGARVGSFTIRDEIVIDTSIRCPEGFFDLLESQSLMTVATADLANDLILTVASSRFAMMGVVEPSWMTTYLLTESLAKEIMQGKPPYKLSRQEIFSKTVMDEPMDVTKEESLAYNRIENEIVDQLFAKLQSLHHKTPKEKKKEHNSKS